MPVLKNLRIFDTVGLEGDGEKAREELAGFLADLDANATRFEERREANRARTAARAG
jgi:acyl-[acyl-carrier-protein] desaturase